MLSTAASLAALTVGAAIVVYHKLPRRVRRFLERHSLLTDMIALIFTYQFLGGTVTALIAAGIVSLAVSALLEVANNKDNYLVLYDLRDYIKSKLAAAKEALDEYCQQYNEKRHHLPSN